jgi:hypothetical protein
MALLDNSNLTGDPRKLQQQQQQADVVRKASTGHAFETLMSQQKPGQLFRSILAGALISALHSRK